MRKLALVLLLGLAGCTTVPATGGRAFSLLTPAMESEIGDSAAADNLNKYGLYKPASSASQYVMARCADIWAATEMADTPVKCLFLDSEEFNAWASPGYLAINRGLLAFVQNEAQLQAVMGHEAGHVTAKHIAKGNTMGTVGSLLATGALIALAANTDDNGTVQIASTLAGVGLQGGMAAYSRSHESEADALGQRYMERAGYDRREGVNMVRQLVMGGAYSKQVAAALNFGTMPSQDALAGFFASHPAGNQRVANAATLAGGEPDGTVRLPQGITPATPGDPHGRARYHLAIDGLDFGPSRTFGVAGRTTLAFPKQQFAWQLPDGFVLQWLGFESKKKMIVWEGGHVPSGVNARFMTMPLTPGMSIPNTLASLLGFKGQVERLALKSGSAPAQAEAFTGAFSPSIEGYGTLPARVVAVALPNKGALAVASFVFTDAAQRAREEPALLAAIQHSRFYSAEEARQLRPLALSSFRATGADTVASRANRLPQGALREELFRTLNGLTPDDTLQAGQWYKTLVDRN